MPLDDVVLNADATAALVDRSDRICASADDPHAAARVLVRHLGADVTGDGSASFGFWAPDVSSDRPVGDVKAVLDVFTPPPDLNLADPAPQVTFDHAALPMQATTGPTGDAVFWAAVDGIRAGSRSIVGAFYRARFLDASGEWRVVHDELAASTPFGAFAPAELYDVDRMHRERGDLAYWASQSEREPKRRNGHVQVDAPSQILQVHPTTSTGDATIAGLARRFREIGRKLDAGEPLTPAEQTYAGYDAVQLTPVEPTIEYENGEDFWTFDEADVTAETGSVDVALRAPDVTNWGYDIPISGSAAVNPVMLETKRPDELVDLASVLHTFPDGPIQLIFDVVYGHVDNQAVGRLPDAFIAGPGMYGKTLDYRHPMVRAHLLDMQRRKGNFGADGIRVDGAQDFKNWDAEAQSLDHDDDYLQEMSDVVHEVGDASYHAWMIFEDGRPWPRDDWELASTYRAVIDEQPDVFQWGPLTFAHNTPFLFGFWIRRWWRIQEMMRVGSHWISGCANHDTLRRGSQVDPRENVNSYLGNTLPEIIEQAYDNPAASLLTYAILPGAPMDFVSAGRRAPWSFIRNTDDRYAIKVASEEAHFMDWRVTVEDYEKDVHFQRLKDVGFPTRGGLHRFMHTLNHAVQATGDDLPAVATIMQAMKPTMDGPEPTVDGLKTVARAWMDDLHDFCNVTHHTHRLDSAQTRFQLSVRRFRLARPWLQQDAGEGEWLRYRKPVNGSVIAAGLRTSPDGSESVFLLTNLEGAPTKANPKNWIDGDDWTLALASPGVEASNTAPITLRNGDGVVWVRSNE